MDVYVTRDTDNTFAEVWVAEIGIVKTKGCVRYESAAQITKKGWMGNNWLSSLIETLTKQQCFDKYGDYPDEGEAWLVEDEGNRWHKWTHTDPDMLLLDSVTGKIIRE